MPGIKDWFGPSAVTSFLLLNFIFFVINACDFQEIFLFWLIFVFAKCY
jgi:hypothetical protein